MLLREHHPLLVIVGLEAAGKARGPGLKCHLLP
jgi:hypothetical protein